MIAALGAPTAFGEPGFCALSLRLTPSLQQQSFTCGPACFRTALLHWLGRAPAERDLLVPLHTQPEGTYAARIAEVARNFNLFASNERGGSLDQLYEGLRRRETIIVLFRNADNLPHFGVLQAMTADSVYLMDPASPTGWLSLSREEFLSRWNDSRWQYIGTMVRISNRPLYPL